MTPSSLRSGCLALLLLPGCGGAPASCPAAPEPPKKPTELQFQAVRGNVAAWEHQERISQGEVALQESANRDALGRLRKELEFSEAQLRQHKGAEAPRRIREAEHELQGIRDSLEDAVEELRQLELMYKDNELADSTKEIVLKRGRRQVERIRNLISIKESQLQALKGEVLPLEEARLAQAVDEKRAEIARETAGGASQLEQKRNALSRAQVELVKARLELEALQAASK